MHVKALQIEVLSYQREVQLANRAPAQRLKWHSRVP
jgi:hypothetical protein